MRESDAEYLTQTREFKEAVNAQTKTYQDFVTGSEFADAPIAPRTLETLAEFITLTRQAKMDRTSRKNGEHITIESRFTNPEVEVKVGEDGSNEKTLLISAELIVKCKEVFKGFSDNFTTKILSQVFNHSANGDEISADPVLLLDTLVKAVEDEDLAQEIKEQCRDFIHGHIVPSYRKFVKNEVARSFVPDFETTAQIEFEKYLSSIEEWLSRENQRKGFWFKDPSPEDLRILGSIEKVEESSQITNPKEFRHNVIRAAERVMAQNNEKTARWDRVLLTKKLIENHVQRIALDSFRFQTRQSDEQKNSEYASFKEKMRDKGYTDKQIVRLVKHMIPY